MPSLKGYDVTIHLFPAPRWSPATTQEDAEDIIPVVNFNPVDNYLRDLRVSDTATSIMNDRNYFVGLVSSPRL